MLGQHVARHAGSFAKGVGEGALDGAVGMVNGVGHLAKGGYHLATSAQARSQAIDTVAKSATGAAQFAKTAVTDLKLQKDLMWITPLTCNSAAPTAYRICGHSTRV
jgi:hypothetical protein